MINSVLILFFSKLQLLYIFCTCCEILNPTNLHFFKTTRCDPYSFLSIPILTPDPFLKLPVLTGTHCRPSRPLHARYIHQHIFFLMQTTNGLFSKGVSLIWVKTSINKNEYV
ncbi:hypothetical protein HanPI659440_Chr15g0603861 [Helianthus annuus]|nr:hypothetical protein HanPI659440_Chr15g0603861 [Helianthus annuus]